MMGLSMKNIVLLGNIGTGKGVISQKLLDDYNFNKISMGDLLRKEAFGISELGKTIKDLINNGKLVPDEIVDKLFNKYIYKNNCLIDGYPRSIGQLENLLKTGYEYLFFIISCDKDTSLKRVKTRLVCQKCFKIFNRIHHIGNYCKCGGVLKRREDDTKNEAVEERYNAQSKRLKEVSDYLKKNDIKTIEIQNKNSIEVAYQEFIKHLGE